MVVSRFMQMVPSSAGDSRQTAALATSSLFQTEAATACISGVTALWSIATTLQIISQKSSRFQAGQRRTLLWVQTAQSSHGRSTLPTPQHKSRRDSKPLRLHPGTDFV